MTSIIIWCFLGFVFGISGAYLAAEYIGQTGLKDIPNGRSSHSKEIPKCGGIGILFALVLTSLFFSVPAHFLFSALVISITSFWGGDRHKLTPKQRLVIQFGCSLFFLLFFWNELGTERYPFLIIFPLSVFVVGTANFYNFMDGIDGIAGITGVIAFSLLAYYNPVPQPVDKYLFVEMVLVFSCAGFLCLNFPKAKVFLGDIGSVLLGFLFAALVIIKSESLTDFLVMSGFLSTFYFDELSTMYVRIKNGESLIKAHRKHIYQILVNELGIEHWKISLAYGCYQVLIGMSVIYLSQNGVFPVLLAYLVYGALFLWVSKNIRKRVSVG